MPRRPDNLVSNKACIFFLHAAARNPNRENKNRYDAYSTQASNFCSHKYQTTIKNNQGDSQSLNPNFNCYSFAAINDNFEVSLQLDIIFPWIETKQG